MRTAWFMAGMACLICAGLARAEDSPRFSRHVTAVFSRLGCNGGTCHGAVQGKNGFRLSLFAAQPKFDHEQIVRDASGRRFSPVEPERSLLLLKATGQVPHGGGRRTSPGSPEYEILRRWLAAGGALDESENSRVNKLVVTPAEQIAEPGKSFPLAVTAEFADGSKEDVTGLCSFTSLDPMIAAVDANGQVQTTGIGDVALIVRYRDEPALARVLVTRADGPATPTRRASEDPHNFIDRHILAKLERLKVPPSPLADDATFLRRIRLDVTGQLPTADEVREFLADSRPDKRTHKIAQLLDEPGYANLWALKFCDLLGAADYGVYADGLAEHYEAPRFHAWVRARLMENLPYDQFAERILTATSREGRPLEEWGQEVIALQEGYATPRKDLDLYAGRRTLDIYWQRKDAVGVAGAMQVAHAFLGLRLECARCHRHPHDVWQQDDLLSFANFFMRVRTVGFQGDNEKKFADDAKLFKQFEQEGKQLAEDAKKLKEGKVKELGEKAKQAQNDLNRLKNELKNADADSAAAKQAEIATAEQTIAEHKAAEREANDMERRGKLLGDEVAKRILHAQVFHRSDDEAAKRTASVTSPLGTQSSEQFRLLGESEPLTITADEDPRAKVAEWLRRPDNRFFAKAIVNRVWAHYFGRGIIDPPDDLSPLNPPTHPELLDELCRQFIAAGYDLKWLHRTILASRTYQQSSQGSAENAADRQNYAVFYYRRLPAEVLLDALNQATGTSEDMDMQYYHWPKGLRAVEIPYLPKNGFVTFMLEQFGRSERNSAVQCDCQRQEDASMLQVLSFANHPRVWQKIADPAGRVAHSIKQTEDPQARIEDLYLSTLGRPPDPAEAAACLANLSAPESPEKGLQGVLWSLLNTREFVLQH